MSAEIRILRPEFRPGPLPLEFMVMVTCGDCGQPPRTLSLTRPEARALFLALSDLHQSAFPVVVNVEGGCE